MPSSLCPQLIPLYTAWKDGLAIMREARLRFQQSGSEEDSRAFDEARELARQARLEYRKAAYETMVKFRGWEICQLESMVVERMDWILQEGEGEPVRLYTEHGRVRLLDLTSNKSTSIDHVVRLSMYFSKLTELFCSYTQLTQLPKLSDSFTRLSCSYTQLTQLPELPDSLTWLDIRFTPAAQDPAIQARLKAFKQSHPNANVYY
jgi:hypothetical protein